MTAVTEHVGAWGSDTLGVRPARRRPWGQSDAL